MKYDNYLDFVRRPMDLGTVKGDMEAGHYPDPGALLLDLRQVPCRPFPRYSLILGNCCSTCLQYALTGVVRATQPG